MKAVPEQPLISASKTGVQGRPPTANQSAQRTLHCQSQGDCSKRLLLCAYLGNCVCQSGIYILAVVATASLASATAFAANAALATAALDAIVLDASSVGSGSAEERCGCGATAKISLALALTTAAGLGHASAVDFAAAARGKCFRRLLTLRKHQCYCRHCGLAAALRQRSTRAGNH